MVLILTARYVSQGLGQFSYREPPEATDSCPKNCPANDQRCRIA
jgi:hypothetical protein